MAVGHAGRRRDPRLIARSRQSRCGKKQALRCPPAEEYAGAPPGAGNKARRQWRKLMNTQRRLLALAVIVGGLTLATALPTLAASADEQAVAAKLEAFRSAQAAKNGEGLAGLLAPELSYSHSDARVEDVAAFLKGATNPATRTLLLEYNNPSIRVVGDVAIVRFTWKSESEVVADGKKSSTNLHVLMTWQKQGGDWKLLARSSTRL
jgi:ketosteroid isomerase-like protein